MLPNPGRGSAETSVGCRKSPREHKGCTRVVQGLYKGCTRVVQGLYKGCTRDVQGLYKGYPREQHHDNTVAIPEQYRIRRGYKGNRVSGQSERIRPLVCL